MPTKSAESSLTATKSCGAIETREIFRRRKTNICEAEDLLQIVQVETLSTPSRLLDGIVWVRLTGVESGQVFHNDNVEPTSLESEHQYDNVRLSEKCKKFDRACMAILEFVWWRPKKCRSASHQDEEEGQSRASCFLSEAPRRSEVHRGFSSLSL